MIKINARIHKIIEALLRSISWKLYIKYRLSRINLNLQNRDTREDWEQMKENLTKGFEDGSIRKRFREEVKKKQLKQYPYNLTEQ